MTRSAVVVLLAIALVGAPLRPGAQGDRNWDQTFRGLNTIRRMAARYPGRSSDVSGASTLGR